MANGGGDMTSDGGVRRGFSTKTGASDAVDEIWEQTSQRDAKLTVFFCSPSYDIESVASRVRERFGDTNVIGCTTAGELGSGGYLDRSLSAFSLGGPSFEVTTGRMDRLRQFDIPDGHKLAHQMLHELRAKGVDPAPRNTFGFLLVDGLSIREENVTSSLYGAMHDIPLFGGSAGDALRFQRTLLYHGGEFRSDCALLTLVTTTRPFEVFKTQHFVESSDKLVITEADPARRVVMEINGEVASREYADTIGVRLEDLGPAVFAAHPLVLSISGNSFVRSIQKVNDDGSLSFYCAIDEGIVLTVAKGKDIVNNLRGALENVQAKVGKPDLIIGCDCVLRNLELGQKGYKDTVGDLLRAYNIVGFSTYGEQFNAMHVNQTFTGVAIGA
jgi:hypothetical protein